MISRLLKKSVPEWAQQICRGSSITGKISFWTPLREEHKIHNNWIKLPSRIHKNLQNLIQLNSAPRYEIHSTSYELWDTSYQLRATSLRIPDTSYELRYEMKNHVCTGWWQCCTISVQGGTILQIDRYQLSPLTSRHLRWLVQAVLVTYDMYISYNVQCTIATESASNTATNFSRSVIFSLNKHVRCLDPDSHLHTCFPCPWFGS